MEKLSRKALERTLEAQAEIIEEKNEELDKLRKDNHRLLHLNIKLYASKCPDICEYFIDCSMRNNNCIMGDNPLRRACKEAVRRAS